MRKISASIVFPISSPPIVRGVVVVDNDGTILNLQNTLKQEEAGVEYFSGIIIPGLVNACCDGSSWTNADESLKSLKKHQQHLNAGTVLVGRVKRENTGWENQSDTRVMYKELELFEPNAVKRIGDNLYSAQNPLLVEFGTERRSWTAMLNSLLQLQSNTHIMIHPSGTIADEILDTLHSHFLNCSVVISPGQSPELLLKLKSKGCDVVLGSHVGPSNLLQQLKSIQKRNDDISFEKMLTWATLNGAKALNMANTFGSLEKNKKPGVLLLSGINIHSYMISESARLTRLV